MGVKMKRNPEGRRAMAEEAGGGMGLTEDDFVTSDAADDAEWRQNAEVRRVQKKLETWWRKFQRRREGRRALEAIHDLSELILEMEEGLVTEGAVEMRACSNELAKVLRDGGLREFGEAGWQGIYKRMMLAWIQIRNGETSGMIVRGGRGCELRWRIEDYDKWYQVFDRGCSCQVRWLQIVMSEGLRWGMDVFGYMEIKDPAQYQHMQLEILDMMVARRVTQFDELEEWMYTQRNGEATLKSEYDREDGVNVSANGMRNTGEDDDSVDYDDGDNNGDVSCNDDSNNNENHDEVSAAGKSQEGAYSNENSTRYNGEYDGEDDEGSDNSNNNNTSKHGQTAGVTVHTDGANNDDTDLGRELRELGREVIDAKQGGTGGNTKLRAEAGTAMDRSCNNNNDTDNDDGKHGKVGVAAINCAGTRNIQLSIVEMEQERITGIVVTILMMLMRLLMETGGHEEKMMEFRRRHRKQKEKMMMGRAMPRGSYEMRCGKIEEVALRLKMPD